MKFGIVGYQGSGKSTLFSWLTGERADPGRSHTTQSAMATVPEPRVAAICDVYRPKKITLAALEIVDTPGLSRTHEGSAQRLAMIREAGCLVIVVAAHDGSVPANDLSNFEDDLLIADLDIVSGRIERLRESVKKPRPNRDEQVAELESLVPVHETLERGEPIRTLELSPDQEKAIRSFQLFTQKPKLVVVNTADDDTGGDRFQSVAKGAFPLFAFSLSLQIELAQMDPAERDDFCAEMGVAVFDRDALVRSIMDTSGQMLFFTAGEKEVRTWMIPKGSTAVEAADGIHTDLARGFIRAETMNSDDLIRLGSEREVKAHSLMRQEPRDYVIRDGDIITIRHSG